MNEVKAMAQRQQEMAKKAAAQQQNGNGAIDPKTAAAVKGKMLMDAQKLQDQAADRPDEIAAAGRQVSARACPSAR